MSKVILNITMSLDGFVTGPNPGAGNGLGDGGEALHDWVFAGTTADDERVLREALDCTGAVVMRRNLFDVVDGPDGWNDEINYGADQGGPLGAQPPCYVITHTAPEHVRLAELMHIVTTGLADGIEQARAAAGHKDVYIMGGGEIGASALRDGLVDRVQLHVAPVILGAGASLFEGVTPMSLHLDESATVVTPNAAHLFYDVR